MEFYRSATTAPRKEIRCSDCGHSYAIAPSQLSSTCEQCGNIGFHSGPALPAQQAPGGEEDKRLKAFASVPDGNAVQEVLMRYQVEWQLWAMTVLNFSDPAYHMAYLTCVMTGRNFELGIGRYRDHRAAMILTKEEHWQAEVADRMIERLERMAVLRFSQDEGVTFWNRLASASYLTLSARSVARVGWIIIGMALLSRIFLPLVS